MGKAVKIYYSLFFSLVLRDGVMVTTRTAGVMQNGGMAGMLLATYRTEGGDEQVSGTFEGTRGGM